MVELAVELNLLKMKSTADVCWKKKRRRRRSRMVIGDRRWFIATVEVEMGVAGGGGVSFVAVVILFVEI